MMVRVKMVMEMMEKMGRKMRMKLPNANYSSMRSGGERNKNNYWCKVKD